MPDFNEILKKTLQGLGETTPEIRQKVYDKAREAVDLHLSSMSPSLSPDLAQARKLLLEKAIIEVENTFQSSLQLKDLKNFTGSFPSLKKKNSLPSVELASSTESVASSISNPASLESISKSFWLSKTLILVFLLFSILVSGAYLFLFRKADFYSFIDLISSSVSPDSEQLDKIDSNKNPLSQDEPSDDLSEQDKPPVKFTERLHSDGTESNPGSYSEKAEAIINRSADAVAALSFSEKTPELLSSKDFGLDSALAQKAILYEESTNASEASAVSGGVVWSLAKESSAPGLPPELAVHGDVLFPKRNIRLRIIIRKNTDATLPASYIIEMIFFTPEKTNEAVVDNVLRVSLKGAEDDTGSSLSGIPAKISDGFFLIALDETAQAVKTNLELLENKTWMDIPMVYKSGQRALITFEKGETGVKVFSEAIKVWKEVGNKSEALSSD